MRPSLVLWAAFVTSQVIDRPLSLAELGLTEPLPEMAAKKHRLHGRFLHITDMHPDPYYKPGSDFNQLCHLGKSGDAGVYGDAVSGCDSPMTLMNNTLQWISKNLRDKVDFVVWTGDNIRHDNDRRFPRTELHIFDMNELVSDLVVDTFRSSEDMGSPLAIPVVPSLGNNDVYPHNLFAKGPTMQTRELFKIWQPFIPPEQLHVFSRGAYFFKEVVRGKLAVLSINTLYLFQSNPLVDNCDRRKQPGYMLFEWLGYVLKEMRSRKMKVWLLGHVPPNEKNYDISCLRKHIMWAHEYRDVIVGSLYGHMNLDHFIPHDAKAAYKSLSSKYGLDGLEIDAHMIDDTDSDSDDEPDTVSTDDPSLDDIYSPIWEDLTGLNTLPTFAAFGDVRVAGGIPNNKVSYMESVRDETYRRISRRKKQGVFSERYSIAHVTASVVPTFNPGIRVWEYNTTGLDAKDTVEYAPWDEFFAGLEQLMVMRNNDDEEESDTNDNTAATAQDSFHIFRKDKTIPPKMPKGTPLGPAYVPQAFTPTRYVQYYADLKAINKGHKKFGYEIEYMTDDKDHQMSPLTVEQWLKYGRKLAKAGKKKPLGKQTTMWEAYLRQAFVSSGYEDMGLG